jgi:hypothetical protein
MAEQTLQKGLGESILEQGIENTNFFNGRILAAGDLKNEQEAESEHHWQLGEAIGSGVVHGLEVSLVSDGSDGNAPIVSVSSGLALNGSGQAIALPFDVQLALEEMSQTLSVQAGLFKECLPTKKGVSPFAGGVYILVSSPASGFSDEKAPMYSTIDNGKVTGCGSRYAIEGVQFRLEELDVSSLTKLSQTTRDALADLTTKEDPASLSKLRNWLAHICFGTEELAGVSDDPFKLAGGESAYVTYGGLDALYPETLTDCDVPLALFYWPDGGIKFVDMWSVRRRPATSSGIPAPWSVYLSERRLREAEAMVLQFEEHIEWLLEAPSFARVKILADQYFRYLPPVGLLPIISGAFKGIDLPTFFSGRPLREPEHIDTPLVYSLVKEAVNYEPIDLSDDQTTIWLYRTWLESVPATKSSKPEFTSMQRTPLAAASAERVQSVRPYVVFASPYMPHAGVARFDLARFDQDAFAGHDN